MSHAGHLKELYGLPVFHFPEASGTAADLPRPGTVAWRIATEVYDAEETWEEVFARFCAAVDTTEVRALVVGAWQDAYESSSSKVMEALLAARGRLPALRALFLGDMTSEEAEISWITQGDVSPLLAGFPALEEFGVRGSQGLRFPALRHDALRALALESGGLPADVVRGVGASELPALEHLDLWLGTSWYGADSEAADLAPILSGDRFPNLRHLALRNSEIQDEVAAAVASAPVVARLDVLDLSMGTLGDEGAVALLGGQPLTHLKKLDLHHNYLSDPVRQRLTETLVTAGVEIDLDPDGAEEYEDEGTVERYVSVGE
ncbi:MULTISPECIES: STM4015 family protein [Streptomyces]|uniref:Leucine-rich repeat domain-containing protein n=1 Tax=Streptomyces prasinus TaxID=67345 RepID=A0ABX6APX6_9ACTN|nr:STM4015 family protein [Streptomyces prasinus]QEV04766.1 leucine-rich repeat domain-containing protein [Streptomyces prasinus]